MIDNKIIEDFNRIIADLEKDGIDAYFFDLDGNLLASKKKLNALPVELFDLAKIFQKEFDDEASKVVIRGKKRFIYIFPFKRFLFVAIGKKEDEALVEKYTNVLR